MRKDARELIRLAKKLGWEHVGYTGSGHFRLVHENGATYVISSTTSDRRSRANAISALGKLAGQKLELRGHRPKRVS